MQYKRKPYINIMHNCNFFSITYCSK